MSQRTVTFDIWDTVLRRRCAPDAVKLFTCRAIALTLHDRVVPRYRDAWNVLALRHHVEQALVAEGRASGRDGDFLLHVLFERLIAAALPPDASALGELSQHAAYFAALEFEQERFVSYVDPGFDALRRDYKDHDTAFLTDFHMSAQAMTALLTHHGLPELAARGLSSGDLGLNKKSGRLFESARAAFGFTPERWVHVGDDAKADVLGPRRLGVTTRHYQPPAAQRERHALEKSFGRSRPFLRQCAATTEAAALLPSRDGQGADREMIAAGAAAAPLFAGFAVWIIESALAHRSEHVYFFAREGYFFQQVYEAFRPIFASAMPLPPSSILSVSRIATFGPSLDVVSPDTLMDMWSIYKSQSLADLFVTLGLEASVSADALTPFGLTLHERIAAPWDDPRIKAFLAHKPANARIMAALGVQRDRLKAYLAAEGLEAQVGRRVTVVDIGWRGSIQNNLARLYPTTQFQGLYLGLEQRGPEPANAQKRAYVTDMNTRRRHAELVTYVAPIEFVCAADVGTTIGYSDSTPPRPILAPIDPATANAYADVVAPFQAGVIAATSIYAREIRTHALASADLLPQAISKWRQLIRKPTKTMARGFARSTIDETFGAGRQFRPRQDLGDELSAPGFSDASSLSTYVYDTVRSVPWPHAFAQYSDQPGAARYLLPMMLRAMRRAKRLRDRLSA
jgi:FMN phosphatase YigB (HAD superfamily)